MHVCLFDIDGTLIRCGGAGQAAMEAALASVFGVTAPTWDIPVHGRTDRGIIADLFRFHGIVDDANSYARFRDGYLAHLPDHLARREGRVLPGILALLEALAARNDVLLGLLTGNFRDGARIKLEHFRLREHFAFGGYGDDHHSRNDVAAEALREACTRVGRPVPGDRVWVIGDTVSDVACARAIGARAVGVSTGVVSRSELQGCSPDWLFDDFSDPQCLLELLA